MQPRRHDPDGSWRWVALLASVTTLVRLVGLLRPVRADEAGFTLVGRAWSPSADSLYGTYFVDRPPSLVGLFALLGPTGVRVLGAVAGAGLVVLAGALGRRLAGAPVPVAVAAAAFVTTPAIDVVAVKGEVLALPLAVGAVVLALAAVRRSSEALALPAGLVAALPLGLKQNLVGAVVFVVVLLVARRAWSLLAAAVAGALLPVVATVVATLALGVDLATLWYTVYGFRGDASAALGSGSAAAPLRRAAVLVLIVVVTGLGAALASYVVGWRASWREDRALTLAVSALVVVDVASLVAGGSFWQDYAFGLVPGALLALCLAAPRARRLVAGFAALSAVVTFAGWGVWNLAGQQEFAEHDTGAALHDVARPGDTLVVFGGRADLQLESGLPSPYPYLWSLPMRTLDPDLTELRALVASPDAPTWLVEWWSFDTWNRTAGDALRAEVEQRYERHGTGCGGRTVWLLRGVERATPEPDCRG